ncbi:MAG: ankyrin repeat domain-containing protein, partial [Halobacteriovoraceae bacterium]|nr:ankyrin repeat domain-containing protein [Halobacteriovoraceae bacterium]
LLDNNANVMALSNKHNTPLHLAAAHGTNPEVLVVLLDNGADIEAKNRYDPYDPRMDKSRGSELPIHEMTPLHAAAIGTPNPAIIKTLLDRGANIHARDSAGNSPLHHAVATYTINPNQGTDVIEELLKHHASVEATNNDNVSPLHLAAFIPNVDIINTLLRHLKNKALINTASKKSGYTPLHIAAGENQNPEVIRVLLNHNADIKAKSLRNGDTPLHGAALYNPNLAVIEILFNEEIKNEPNNKGITPFHYATINPNPNVMRFFITKEVDIMALNIEKHTPLHYAAAYGTNPLAIDILVNNGAVIDAQSINGSTPLHTAAISNQNPAIIEALLKNDADPHALDFNLMKPVDIALRYNPNPEVRSVLQKATAIDGDY